MSYYDEASLVMIPSGYKTSKVYSVKPTDGSGDLVFSRSNDTATRVGPDGLIEKVRTNLLTYSQDFTNAAWVKAASTSITASGVTDPNGGTTAVTVSFPNSTSEIYQSLGSLTGSYTDSIYVKGTAGETIALWGVPSYQLFTLTGEWQRISKSNTLSGSTAYLAIGRSGTAATATSVSIAFAQFETGDIATSYIATTTAAVSVGPVANVPRLDYLNSSCPRLLLEGQRTNTALYSEQFTNAVWTGSASTVVGNQAASPDGYTNADLLYPATSGNFAGKYQSLGGATTGVISCYVKQAGKRFAQLGTDNNATYTCAFDLQLGTVVRTATNYTATIASVGNGWYRITAAYVSSAQNNYPFIGVSDNAAGAVTVDGTNGLYLYGFQYETSASYATSYIPTLGSASTRGNELASKSSINALIGGTSGTIFFEIKTNKTLTSTNYKQFFYYTDASSAQAYMYLNGSNTLVLNPSLGNISSSINLAADTTYKIAVAYATNDFKLYINGVERGSSTSGTSINAVNLLSLGSYQGTSEFNEFVFSQYIHFPTRLSNSDLAALTA